MENVSKRYYLSSSVYVDALIDVNLTVKSGEVLVVMGPSGSGKTTLLNIIGTLDRPTKGRVYIGGVEVSSLSEGELFRFRLNKIGFLFQQYNLISNLTALENVMMPMMLSGLYDRAMAEAKARMLLSLVDLEQFANHRPSQLSGGQQQRVALARALAMDPEIIIMDEPTGALDPVSASRLLALIKSVNEALGKTIILATHNPDVAQIASRLVHIRGGRLFEGGQVERIRLTGVDARGIVEKYIKALEIDLLVKRRLRLMEDADRVEESIRRLEEYLSNTGNPLNIGVGHGG